jgi:FtsP/CotA-like multicopper oxidase with cupredoxin domain
MGAHETATGAVSAALSASEQMDAMHEKGIKAFPAKTAGKGNQLLEPKLVNGVKVYELTASKIQWEVEPGRSVEAWAYNNQIPGPQIRVKEGDRVRVVLKNELPESTVIHFHGLELPNNQDGVPFITQPPVKPGQLFTYEFTVPNAGSHMYHSHHNAAKQVGLGCSARSSSSPRRRAPSSTPTWITCWCSTTARMATRSTVRAFRRRNRSLPSSARRCAFAS